MTNRDFRKVVFKKEAVISDSFIEEDLVKGNFYRRTRLVTHVSTCSNLSTRLPTEAIVRRYSPPKVFLKLS